MKRILFALLLAAAAPLHAQQFCVGTAAELEQRLQLAHGLAAVNPASNVEIRVRRSATTYVIDDDVPSDKWGQKYASLSIRGGYSDDPLDACTTKGESRTRPTRSSSTWCRKTSHSKFPPIASCSKG